jgi:hypothetical protein
MPKYLIIFVGGKIPEDKKRQSITDRLKWMENLRNEGKFVDGSPLKPEGKIIHGTQESSYNHNDNSVNGYAIISVDNIDEAVLIGQAAPQVSPEYGSAVAEIRPLLPLI